MIPILNHKHPDKPSVFLPDGLLREARREKSVPLGNVPDVCVLDPDGDLFRSLKASGARPNPHWACYHTELYELKLPLESVGVVGCAVGAPFAVLVAEELFASGCRLLVSVTSAGQIVPAGPLPYFVLIDRALRDEGTSYHYLPSRDYAVISQEMLSVGLDLLRNTPHVVRGGAWTTDAPFRETDEAIAFARSEGLLAVEMEAAALYAFAEARRKPVICFAYVTNQMATVENDFGKGEAGGNRAMSDLVSRVARIWRNTHEDP